MVFSLCISLRNIEETPVIRIVRVDLKVASKDGQEITALVHLLIVLEIVIDTN